MNPCVLIPVYNNRRTVADVVSRCLKVTGLKVLVVSDGSTDGSDGEAEQAGATLLRLPTNAGKGNAIRRGLKEANELGYTHAVVLDADGQHPPEEIPNLLEAARTMPDAIWVGVRKMDEGNAPTSSKRGRSISNFWATLNGWQRSKDTQCGFRVYPVDATSALPCKEMRFTYEMEVLVRASWAGMPIRHREVEVVYEPAEKRVTHFDMRRDNLAFTWLSFKMFWGMVARSPVLLFRKLFRR